MVRSHWLMGNGNIAGGGRAVHHAFMDDTLNDAIASLAAFRASCDDDELIDEESKLTSAKLDLILAQLSWPEGEPEEPKGEGDQSLHDAVATSKANLNRFGTSDAPVRTDPHKTVIMDHVIK
jgi:hypothetical protein